MSFSSSIWSCKKEEKHIEKLNRKNRFDFYRFSYLPNLKNDKEHYKNETLPKLNQLDHDCKPENDGKLINGIISHIDYVNLLICNGVSFNKSYGKRNNNEKSNHDKLNEQIKIVNQFIPTIEDDQILIDKIRNKMKENENKLLIDNNDLMDIEDNNKNESNNNLNIEHLIQARRNDISNIEKENVTKVLNRKPNLEVVILKFKIDMTVKKIQCLKPYTWLNDEVINFYMCMLQERDLKLSNNDPNRKRSFYFNSFFIAKLLEGGVYTYSNIKRWSKTFDVFTKNKIFMPININNTHWTMAIVFILKKEIHYYDSMSGSGSKYLKAILRWLQDEAREKKGFELNTSEWKLYDREDDVPQQHNGADCGVFSIMCADYISDNLPINSYHQGEMLCNRIKITASILRGELLY